MAFQLDRRDFMKVAGAGTAATLVLPELACVSARTLRSGTVIRGRKLNLAVVGCGGRGKAHVRAAAAENVVALCDVDRNRAAGSFDAHPQARRFDDFREMLTEMDEQIDGVLVATPDHMHYPAAMMAVSQGKHVYVEKPLTHTVTEARTLTRAVRRHKVISQMGNQGHAKEGARLLREWVQAGVVGEVREVHTWTNRPIWPQGMAEYPPAEPVPETLNWNLWQGVATARAYNHVYLPFNWRGWWDYGCGALGDMGCHVLDAAFWALDLKYPTRVQAEVWGGSSVAAPKSSIITYEFPARKGMPPLTLKWYDGDKVPPRPAGLEEGRAFGGKDGGMLIVGSKATILDQTAYCTSPRIIPDSKMKAIAKEGLPPKTILRVPGSDPFKEWIAACKGEGPMPGSNFDYSGPLTEMVLMGNLAVRMPGKSIEWNGPRMVCTNIPEANELLKKTYREF